MEVQIPPPCYEFLGCTLLESGDGKARIRIETQESWANPYGIVQGGILVGLLDNAIGPAGWTAVDHRPTTTLSMAVHYQRPTRPGKTLLGIAEVVHKTRRFLTIEARLEDEKTGKVLVRATATNVLLET